MVLAPFHEWGRQELREGARTNDLEVDFSPELRLPLEVENISGIRSKALVGSARDLCQDRLASGLHQVRAGTKRGIPARLVPPAARGTGAGNN